MKTQLFAIKRRAKNSSTIDFNNTRGTAYRVWYISDNF